MENLVALLLCVGIVHLAAATSRRIDSFTQTPTNPVLEGDMVVVWCIGFGNSQRWYINGILVRSNTFDPNVYRINHYGDLDASFWNTSINFTATLDKNETDIRCDMIGSSTDDATNSTTLILAGPPSALTTSLEDLHDGMVLRLSWTEPFTQAPYPITSYNVVVYNESAGADNVLINSSLNATQHHYDFVKPNNSATCPIVTFAASATNDIGTSNVSSETGVFPMIPDVNNLNIGQEIVFVNGITPRLTVWFQEPKVCSPLQDQANYTLEVLDESGQVIASSGLREATAGPDGRVVTKFMTGLSSNMEVSIRLTLMHSRMSWSRTATQENISIPTLQPPAAESDSPVVTKMATSSSAESTTIIIITVVSVGVTILILVILIVFIALIFVVVNKGRRQVITVATEFSPGIVVPTMQEFKLQAPPKGKKVPKSLPTMEANPIYDGPMYDSPGGESLKQLLGGSSVPSTPASEYPRYAGMPPPPSLPPPRKTMANNDNAPPQFSFSSSSSSLPANETCNDAYTEMKPTPRGGCTILRPPDVLPAVYEAMGGDPLYEVTN